MLSPHDDQAGSSLRRFRIRREIGRGRRARVLEVEDLLLGRRVAFKRALDPSHEALLLDEGRRLAGVRTPHVVQLYDILDHPATLVLELLEGATLRSRMQTDLPLELTMRIVTELLEALRAIHTSLIVHGDIKPENLWITPDGCLKLLDLGTTPVAAGDATALYAAPEVGLGATPSEISDVYSAACVAYELVAHRLPFDASDPAELATRKSQQKARSVLEAGAVVSAPVAEWLQRALEIDPGLRFPNAGDARRAWQEACGLELETRNDEPSQSVVLQERARAELDRLWTRTRCGEGGVVAITGEPGIGKTFLLEEWAASKNPEEAIFLWVRMPAHVRRHPHAAWKQALASRALLDRPELLPPDGVLDPDAETRLHERWEQTLGIWSKTTSLFVLADDLDRLDGASRRFVLRLAVRAKRLGVVVTIDQGTANRATRVTRRALVAGGLVPLQLVAPDPEPWRLFVANRLEAKSVSDALATHLYTRSGGRPGLAVLLLEDLLARGALRHAGEGWVFRPERVGIEVPQAAAAMLRRQLIGLVPAARSILETAVLQGPRVTAGPLAKLLEQTEIDVVQTLHEIELDTGIVHREDDTYVFAQPPLAEYLYARLAPEKARVEHHRLARVLIESGASDESIGEQLQHAGALKDALPYLEKAGRAALQDQDAVRALHLFDLACPSGGPDPQDETEAARHVELGLLRGRALRMLAAWDKAVQELEAATMVAQAWGLGVAEMQSIRALGDVEYARSRYDVAVEHYLRAQTCAADLGDELEMQELGLKIGNIHFERGELEGAMVEYERVLDYSVRLGQPELEARAANNVALVESIQGRKDKAVQFFNQSLAQFRLLGRVDAMARLNMNIGMIYLELGNWAEARNFFQKSMEESEASNQIEVLAASCLDYAEATIRLGSHEAAAAPIERALAICRERGDELGVANAYRLQACVAAARGDHKTAEQRLQLGIELSDRLGQSLQLGLCWKELGTLRLEAGDPQGGIEALEKARQVFGTLDATSHATEVETRLRRCREKTTCSP